MAISDRFCSAMTALTIAVSGIAVCGAISTLQLSPATPARYFNNDYVVDRVSRPEPERAYYHGQAIPENATYKIGLQVVRQDERGWSQTDSSIRLTRKAMLELKHDLDNIFYTEAEARLENLRKEVQALSPVMEEPSKPKPPLPPKLPDMRP